MRRPSLLSFLVLVVLLASLPGATASDGHATDIQTVGEQLVCYCGCSGLTVAACTCGTADSIRDRIHTQLESGLSTDQVVAEWVAERGEQILAVPTREGFNLVGWAMPFVVALASLTVVAVGLLRRRSGGVPEPVPLSDDERRFLQRIDDDVRTLRG